MYFDSKLRVLLYIDATRLRGYIPYALLCLDATLRVLTPCALRYYDARLHAWCVLTSCASMIGCMARCLILFCVSMLGYGAGFLMLFCAPILGCLATYVVIYLRCSVLRRYVACLDVVCFLWNIERLHVEIFSDFLCFHARLRRTKKACVACEWTCEAWDLFATEACEICEAWKDFDAYVARKACEVYVLQKAVVQTMLKKHAKLVSPVGHEIGVSCEGDWIPPLCCDLWFVLLFFVYLIISRR